MDTSSINHVELIKKIHSDFRDAGLKLSVAESCTGGLIAHLLTSLPGASVFFDSSIVCYSNQSKMKLLGIRKSVINMHGVISEEMAREMAISIRERRKTDYSLSITGNLGPDVLEDKKAGLVYIAVDFEKTTESKGIIFEGQREEIKYQAAVASLQFLNEVLETWK